MGSEELIVVKQLPVIEDRLDEAYNAVQERLDTMASLVVTEENYKELKKTRADLNKEFGELENLRKTVKEMVEHPYKVFEMGAYRRIADKYKGAISEIDKNIKEVEGDLKSRKYEEVDRFFDEYRQSVGIDSGLISLERSGIRVGLSGSLKSYKNQVVEYINSVVADLRMIETLENADEVLAEYRLILNVSEAVRIVNERKRRVEEEKIRREAQKELREVQEEPEEVYGGINVVSISKEVEDSQSDLMCVMFFGYSIYGTENQIRELKEFLKKTLVEYMEREGIDYE